MSRPALTLVLLLAGPVLADEAVLNGTLLDIRMPGGLDEVRSTQLETWVRDSAESAMLVYGRLPMRKVTVILRAASAWGSDEAVTFGQTTRRGGGQIELFINPDRPIEEFYTDWTATHEFSHLLLPLLERKHRWISEGFASYYQNLLMARAGRYTEAYAWQRLREGLERGRNSRPELSPNQAASARARMKYYWSGAAIALLADVELREKSGNTQSLDSVLEKLAECCLPARYRWTGPELFKRLDSLLDEPVFMPLYDRYADAPGFPNVSYTLSNLGVAGELNEHAPLANVRRSMTRKATF